MTFNSKRAAFAAFLILSATFLFATNSGATRRDSAASTVNQTNKVTGDWDGVLSVAGVDLRLVLKITSESEDVLKATMDSLDQPGSMGLTVDEITLKDGTLRFVMKRIYASYEGT